MSQPESEREAIQFLLRVHYDFFMANPRFYYERDLIEADGIICKLASSMRTDQNSGAESR